MRPSHVYPLLIAAACAGHLGKRGAATMLIRDLKAILPLASRGWVKATSPYVHAEDRLRFIEGLGLGGLD
jgi:hypothetical protein